MALGKELDYRLRWMDFDRYGRIQPVAILDMFQDAATLQADEMGIGRDDMLAKGVFWAVVRLKYEIVDNPTHFQIVTVKTWPHSPTRFSFLRDYTMRDEIGNLLIKGTSEWVLMDNATRSFAKMTDYYDGPYDFDDQRAFDSKPRKLHDFDSDAEAPFTIVPHFSDIDVNGHVNNARYASFIVDALDFGPGEAIKTIQIDYRHEVMPGSPLAIHSHANGSLIQSKGVREDGTVAFASAIELQN